MDIEIGAKLDAADIVTAEKTAKYVGSGGLEVYATPCMAALMEKAAYELLQKYLPEGSGSVGISLDLEHTSATPVGMGIRAEAEITAAEKRIITFNIKAYDGKGKIGHAVHKRCIVDNERFFTKAQDKLNIN